MFKIFEHGQNFFEHVQKFSTHPKFFEHVQKFLDRADGQGISKEKRKLKLWQLESPEPLEILEPKLIEKHPTLTQAMKGKFVNLT